MVDFLAIFDLLRGEVLLSMFFSLGFSECFTMKKTETNKFVFGKRRDQGLDLVAFFSSMVGLLSN